MKLEYVELADFRCFPHLSVKCTPGINLLIGDNATGKTSLLRAIKYACSAFFSGFSDENTQWTSPTSSDFRVVESDGFEHPDQPLQIKFQLSYHSYTPDLGPLALVKLSKKNRTPLIAGIKPLKDYGKWLSHEYFSTQGQTSPLPLFACFATSDIHTPKGNDKLYLKYTHKPTFGYHDCLAGKGMLAQWINRLLALAESGECEKEMYVVAEALLKALGPEGCNIISKVHPRPRQKDVFFTLTDGRIVKSSDLSDGYMRLIGIVIDLAFRCYWLNASLMGCQCIENTEGVVVIDEIDLHLHPSLQAVALPALNRTFPNLQIFASTHAPMVMSGIPTDDAHQVCQLQYDPSTHLYSCHPQHTYGSGVGREK